MRNSCNQHAQASQLCGKQPSTCHGPHAWGHGDAERDQGVTKSSSLLMDQTSTEVSDFRDPGKNFSLGSNSQDSKTKENPKVQWRTILVHIYGKWKEDPACRAAVEMQTRDQTCGNGGEGEEGWTERGASTHTHHHL